MTRPYGEAAENDSRALELTLQQLARNASAMLGVSAVAVALLDPLTGDLVTRTALGFPKELAAGSRFRPSDGIQGWVGAHLKPVFLNEIDAGTRFESSAPADARSLACIPLLEAGQLLGTLTVASPLPSAFTQERLSLLDIFSEQAVLAISKTIQAEASRAQARELSTLLDASRALTSSLDVPQVCAYIVASIRKAVTCEDAIIYIHEPRTGMLHVAAGMGARAENLESLSVAVDDPHSLAAWVAKNGRARLSAPGFDELGLVTSAFLSGETMSLLCVPLISKEVVRGVIMLARGVPFTSSELGTMLNLSSIIAAALENAALYQTAWLEREQQAAIFASASDGIAIVDSSLHIVEANDAFGQLLGMPKENMLRQRVCSVLERESSSVCELCQGDCLVAESLRTGQSQPHVECEFLSRDTKRQSSGRLTGGRLPLRYVDFSITPMHSVEGERVLLVGRDVSAAREMDQMKANFLSMVSHELRSPLQTINGYLDILLSGMAGPLLDQQNEFVRRARTGSEHLTALVDDLLLISRRDAGQFSLHRKPTDLIPVIRETVEELELFADDAGVSLLIDMPDALPTIAADGARMGQVLRNLITNAVKFTPSGGQVRVLARETADAIELEVRDSGIGISQEHFGRIFERFYQVGNATTRGRFQGQGLGLAIVRIIVEGHGGTVTVDSKPQRGSSFVVRLPRSDVKSKGSLAAC